MVGQGTNSTIWFGIFYVEKLRICPLFESGRLAFVDLIVICRCWQSIGGETARRIGREPPEKVYFWVAIEVHGKRTLGVCCSVIAFGREGSRYPIVSLGSEVSVCDGSHDGSRHANPPFLIWFWVTIACLAWIYKLPAVCIGHCSASELITQSPTSEPAGLWSNLKWSRRDSTQSLNSVQSLSHPVETNGMSVMVVHCWKFSVVPCPKPLIN